MKVSILTLGCRVNQSESAIIEGNLSKLGWSIVGLSEHPDYCIVNTCTVTAKSDYQSRQLIRRAVRAGAKVIVTGCYAQLRPDDITNIEGVISIVNNNKKLSIINMLSNNTASITFSYSCNSRPYLKIQNGCNFKCTYCAVPMARGRSRSLEVSEVVRQAKEIEATGYNEIVLTGIHLGSYGHDLKPKTKLSKLLKTLLKETKIPRIRLSSIEITEVDDEFIELLREQRICKHIHLPLQSGDNTILRLMNRMYTSEDYASTAEDIIKKVPDIAIGTDVIVGFPGEGNIEFLNTKRLLNSLPIAYMHIFPFSPRPDTIASKMSNQNTSAIRKERFNELKALNVKKKMAYMLLQINKTLDVIIEEQGIDNISIGTSSNYLKVKILSNGCPKGALVRVRASEIEGNLLKGDLIEKL
ncbi:MAG: tRNA (N(6)-L-threonylcarbamoyladenosine(37)-C(2))-methylthiotransferase MtaB [Nitrospirae bacterium]|nr:tRNA (N(6)-L-threonylcarbamoyladenosine(37)-C(2))-methylthiotransferase MtaB [Nitrospirota bacterium]